MLTEAWTPLRYHEGQTALWRGRERFKHAACGRGSGKTEVARRYVVRWLPVKKEQPAMYFYGLPTRQQAKRVAWTNLCALIPRDWIAKISESDMMIRTHFGNELWCVGLDKPQRIEGNQWDGGILDESCDIKSGTFGKSVVPALSHKYGWCWRIGVPKRTGVGAAEFKAACIQAADAEDSMYRTWPSRDILTPDQLKWARQNLDPVDYKEQYEASWETATGTIFYAFSTANVSNEASYNRELPLIVGSDFNVDPMCWVIGQRHGPDEFFVIDEICLRNTNTPAALDELWKRFQSHTQGFEFYGDASGQARKTSASMSDYLHIKNDTRFRKNVHYPKNNPRLKDRFSSCNAMLLNAEGRRRCLINPRCKRLIKDLEDRAYLEGTNEPADTADMGHMSDAWGYVMHALFRIKLIQQTAPRIFIRG